MSVTVKFLGAAGTVTGSKYLVRAPGVVILVDAGVFQGPRDWTDKNWIDFEKAAGCALNEIQAVLLTHAHIDHIGLLPRLRNFGLNCPVFCTAPTQQLAGLLLRDMGHLQEEEAEYRARKGYSRFHEPKPLYTEQDAVETLKLLKTAPIEKRIEVLPNVFAQWRVMGHIIGACSINLEIGGKIITFSGDIGRYNVPILKDPEPQELGDLLLIESTYGDRNHPTIEIASELSNIINQTARRGGSVIIPSFAVGRAQLLLFYLRELKEKKLIPDLPIIVDSPMSQDATQIYLDNHPEYDGPAKDLLKRGIQPFMPPRLHFIQNREESKRLNAIHDPMIIISASGMLSGGRILHHIFHRISSPLNTILFIGFQPDGSRGALLKSGIQEIHLFHQRVRVRAQISEISGLSAHGDLSELLRWCKASLDISSKAPRQVAIVHGEPDSAESFRLELKNRFGWNGFVAKYLEEITV
ncbi:MAG: MBL fold metallo-hydrolase [bacterium]|nr:MBL fold metallo-hydrolase [bacterium]